MDMNFKPGDNDQNVLEKFGRNLNQEVKNNKVDPIIGRDNEIRRVIEIISRKNKNNTVLIGEPGVGKTAIVEGLAQKIVKGDVPSNLKDKVIFELSLPSLIAGASYQGQFEERINSVIKEVKKSNGNIILFIDEIHQLVGTGKTAGGSMDAANILKPAMARGEIKIIGATTFFSFKLNSTWNMEDPSMKMMPTMMTVMIIVTALFMPSGLGIYWATSNLFTIVQNVMVKRSKEVNGKA